MLKFACSISLTNYALERYSVKRFILVPHAWNCLLSHVSQTTTEEGIIQKIIVKANMYFFSLFIYSISVASCDLTITSFMNTEPSSKPLR